MKRSLGSTLALIGLLALSASHAQAQNAAYNFTDTIGFGTGGPGTFGSEFTVNTDINVTALGFFDSGQDGLLESHDLGLFDSSGTLLASATVSSGTTNPLVGTSRYVNIAPLTLMAGQNYVLGAYLVSGSQDAFVTNATGFSTPSEISYVTTRIAPSASLAFPNLTVFNFYNPGAFGPNLLFSPAAAVPEPAFVAMSSLLALGGGGLLLRRRRARA